MSFHVDSLPSSMCVRFLYALLERGVTCVDFFFFSSTLCFIRLRRVNCVPIGEKLSHDV
jgi:hypothetical protein